MDEDGDLSFNPMEPSHTALMFEKAEVVYRRERGRGEGGTQGYSLLYAVAYVGVRLE